MHPPEEAVSNEVLCEVFRWMLLGRLVDEKLASLYRGGKILGGVYLGMGQEAVSASLGAALRKGDIFAPLIRDDAGRFAFGEPIIDCFRTYLGSRLGPMQGRDGNIHRGRPSEGLYPMISHLGAMISVVSGALLARRLKGETGIVGATCIGDGGTSTGAFHEGMNLAAVEKLPLVMVVTNNQYAYSTPTTRQFACANLVDRAAGYGIRGTSVDGTDLFSTATAIRAAVERARNGGGPELIVAEILRLGGHGEHDDASYVDPALRSSPKGRDCVKVAEQYLVGEGFCSAEDVAKWRADVQHQVEEVLATVQSEAPPNPAHEDWCAISTRHLIGEFAL